jgi:hypothetical protein
LSAFTPARESINMALAPTETSSPALWRIASRHEIRPLQ